MDYKVFYDILKKRIGTPNQEKPDAIASAIARAYNMSCMGVSHTWYGSTFIRSDEKLIKNAIVDAFDIMSKSQKDIMIGWQTMAVGFAYFWKSAEFTPIPPMPPCTGPAPDPVNTGTKVIASEIDTLSNGLKTAFKKNNFDEFVDSLYDNLMNYHLTIGGNYFGITGVPPVPTIIFWKGIFGGIKNKNSNNISFLGRGSLFEVIRDFENNVRNNGYESLIYTDYNGNLIKKIVGSRFEVLTDTDTVERIKILGNCIASHNHPIEYNSETAEEVKYASFSSVDIIHMITLDLFEERVVDSGYTYVMQKPKNGWGELRIGSNDDYRKPDGSFDSKYMTINPKYEESIKIEFKKELDLQIDILSSTISDENVVFGEATHLATKKICNTYGITYIRAKIK